MAGGVDFDQGKFNELIVYLATRLPPRAALGRVKLAKLLMHSDFTAYVRLGRSITGATYEKWEYGHFPRELVMTEKDLRGHGIDIEPVAYHGLTLKRIAPLREPDLSRFTEDELAIVEGALRAYGHESAKYLSDQAHKQVGWKSAKYKEAIPYNTFYLGEGGVSEADIRRGEELASLHGWN